MDDPPHRMPGFGSQRLNHAQPHSRHVHWFYWVDWQQIMLSDSVTLRSVFGLWTLDLDRANAAMEWRHIYSIASAIVVLLAVVLMSLCSLGLIPSDFNEGVIYKSEGQIEVYTGVCTHSKTRIICFMWCNVLRYKFTITANKCKCHSYSIASKS